MNGPILLTDDLKEVKAALLSNDIEAIVYKGGVPSRILDLMDAFNFSRISRKMERVDKGRDIFNHEIVLQNSLAGYFPELAPVDAFVENQRSLFDDLNDGRIGGPTLSRRHHAQHCHFITPHEVIMPQQVPHVDSPNRGTYFKGDLKESWEEKATPGHYPQFKMVAQLNRTGEGSTILIPNADKGPLDPDNPYHYPRASMVRAVSAEAGDITFLKQLISVHRGPNVSAQRWSTTF